MTKKTIPIRFFTGPGIFIPHVYTDYQIAVGDVRAKGGFVMLFTPREAKRVVKRYPVVKQDKTAGICEKLGLKMPPRPKGVAVKI